MEIIDSHVHIGKFDEWDCRPDVLVECMRNFGVNLGIVSDLGGIEYNNSFSPVNTSRNQIQVNSELVDKISIYGNTFKALFWIRPRAEAANQELEEYLVKNKRWFVGIKVHPRYANLKFTGENYYSYLELCRKLSLPMCVHTEKDGFSNIAFVRETAEQYPGVNFVAIHMGFGTDRKEAIRHIKECSNLYGDTTLVSTSDVINAIQMCGDKKILFGSDAPVLGQNSYERYRDLEERLRQKYSAAVLNNLFRQNAKRIFHLL